VYFFFVASLYKSVKEIWAKHFSLEEFNMTKQLMINTTNSWRRWATPVLVAVVTAGVALMGGHSNWLSDAVTVVEAQNSNRQLTYRRIELTSSDTVQRAQGSAVIKSVIRNGRTAETFTAHVFNLSANERVQLFVNGRRLDNVRANGRGGFEVTYVRGQQPGPGQQRLPITAPAVTQFDTVEVVSADGRTVRLSGSYDLVSQGSLTSITSVRILNAEGKVVLQGNLSPSKSESRQVTLQPTQVDPNAKGQATIRLTDLTAGGFEQEFDLSVDDLDINPPFMLELNGGQAASFTTNASGRAEVAYKGRLETQAGQMESSSAIAEAEFSIFQARQAIDVAASFGAETNALRNQLNEAEAHLNTARSSQSQGNFDQSVDSALSADDSARDTTQQAVETAAQAEQDSDDNGNTNGNDNGDDDNDNGDDDNDNGDDDNDNGDDDNDNGDDDNDNGDGI
jgi:hypothetical protein